MFSVNLADSLPIHYYYSPINSEFTPVGLRTYLEVVSIFGKSTGILQVLQLLLFHVSSQKHAKHS